MAQKIFRLPVSWQMMGEFEVVAGSPDEAQRKLKKMMKCKEPSLPPSDYVKGSIRVLKPEGCRAFFEVGMTRGVYGKRWGLTKEQHT